MKTNENTNRNGLVLEKADLRLFDITPNVTTDSGLTAAMKTFYEKTLIDNAKPELVHEQFGQKKPIPKNSGKTIEFRKYAPLTKATTPLTEGVTPEGKKLSLSTITSQLKQYGDFIPVSDILTLTAIDNELSVAAQLLGAQSGQTRDTIIREVLNGGTNVQFAEGQVTSRTQLTGEHKLTVKACKLAVRALKNQNAKRINGSWAGIIHPDCAFDLTEDPDWKYPHQYADTEHIYEGEIGKVAGIRFVETTEAKKWVKGGAEGRDVYSTLILGANAYGVTDLEGGGMEFIFKPLGSAGAADPLNQRATSGWKCTMTAERLVEQYMVRIETGSTFNDGAAN